MRELARRAGFGRLSGDAVAVALGELAAFGYPLVSIPFLSRTLGASSLGRLMFVMSIIQIGIIIVDYGFSMSAVRSISLAPSRRARAKITGATITAKGILYIGIVIILLIIVVAVPRMREYWVLYISGLAMISGHIAFPSWLLQGIGKMKTLAIVIATSRLVALVGLVSTVRSSDDIAYALIWQFAPYSFAALIAWLWIYSRRLAYIVRVPPRAAFAALQESTPLFLSSLATAVIGAGNSIVLGTFSTVTQVAYFGTAERVANAARGVLGSVKDSMLPRMVQAEENLVDKVQRRLIIVMLVGAFFTAGITIIFISPWLIPWYLGAEYDSSVLVAQILGSGLCFAGVTAACTLILVSRNRYAALSRIMIIGAAIHVCLLPMGAIWAGATGVAMVAAVSEVILVALLLPATRASAKIIGHEVT